MSRKQPVGQVRLTNIAIVKYKAKGLRFEIACFPNKVLDWRKKIESNLNNVIQSTNIFSNVSKGSFARRDDCMEAFGTLDSIKIIEIILEKGELQVTEKERQNEIATRTKEIITIVAGMCVNSETKQPVSHRVIETALKGSSFQINLAQPVKQQAMRVFRLLSQTLPIERAKMKILISAPAQYAKVIKTMLSSAETEMGLKTINIVQTLHSIEFSIIIDPGHLRAITDDVTERTNGQGDVSVVDLQVDTEDLLTSEGVSFHNDDDDDDDAGSDGDENDFEKKQKKYKNGEFGPSLPDNVEFGGALDLDQIGATFGLLDDGKGKNTSTKREKRDKNNNQNESHFDQQNASNDTKTTSYSNTTQLSSYDDYSDSDDDISFILSKSVTVLKEEDISSDEGPRQVAQMQIFSRPKNDEKNNLDDIDDDDENDMIEHKRQLRTKYKGFITNDLDNDVDNDYEYDENSSDTDNEGMVSKMTKNDFSKNKNINQNTTKSPLLPFLHTNIAKTIVGTRIQSLNAAASVHENKSGRVVTKFDPESTLYREFMHHFDTQDEQNDEIPLLKQDEEVLQAIKRQIAIQQQHASEEFEWFLEFDGDDAEQDDDDSAIGV